MSFMPTKPQVLPPARWRTRTIGTTDVHLIPMKSAGPANFQGITPKVLSALFFLLFDESYTAVSAQLSPKFKYQIRGNRLALRITDQTTLVPQELDRDDVSIEDASKFLIERYLFNNNAKTSGVDVYAFDVMIPISAKAYAKLTQAQVDKMLYNTPSYSPCVATYLQVELPWEPEHNRFLDDAYCASVHAVPVRGYVTIKVVSVDPGIPAVWVVLRVADGEVVDVDRFIVKKGTVYETFKTVPSILKQ